jgi:hypothetical protein
VIKFKTLWHLVEFSPNFTHVIYRVQRLKTISVKYFIRQRQVQFPTKLVAVVSDNFVVSLFWGYCRPGFGLVDWIY